MNRVPLIGLVGRKRAGKDATAEALNRHGGYHRLAFADALKEVVLDINPILSWDVINYRPKKLRDYVERWGWEKAKENPEVRRLLQDTGVAVRNHVGKDSWVRAVMDEAADRVWGRKESVVITDVRFGNEAKAVQMGNGILIRVVRPGQDSADLHVSETALDGWPTSLTLVNDGSLEDLDRDVRRMLEHLNNSSLVQV